MPSCSSCGTTSSSTSAHRACKCKCVPGAKVLGCCAPRCPFVYEQTLQAVGSAKTKCQAAIESPSQVDSDFGIAIAMSANGCVLAVGAPKFDVTKADGKTVVDDAGAVFVYERNKSFAACQSTLSHAFELRQILVATNPKTCKPEPDQDDNGDEVNAGNFGMCVAVAREGDRIAVGAPFQATGSTSVTEDAGAVYIFDRVGEKNTWKIAQKVVAQRLDPETQKVVPESASETMFGYRIALSRTGHVLLVGNPGTGDSVLQPAGLAYFYEDCSPSGAAAACLKRTAAFALVQRVTAADLVEAVPDLDADDVQALGSSVALSPENGNVAVVGAALSSVSGADVAGLVFVLRRNPHKEHRPCARLWKVSQVLNATVPQVDSLFGDAVRLTKDGEFLFVEEPGRDKPYDGMSVNVTDLGSVSAYRQKCVDGVQTYVLEDTLCPVQTPSVNIEDLDGLGIKSLAASDDGCVVSVGYELSDVSALDNAGAVVIYRREQSATDAKKFTWKQAELLVQPGGVKEVANFGAGMDMSFDGTTLAVGATSLFDLENVVDTAYTFTSKFKAHH